MWRWNRLTLVLEHLDKGWRYWLQPWEKGRGLRWDELSPSWQERFLLLETGHKGEALLREYTALVDALERVEARAVEEGWRGILWRIFGNEMVVAATGEGYRRTVRVDIKPVDEEALHAACALYQALYVYLMRENRYASLQADVLTAFAAWQWYNLLKQITDRDIVRYTLKLQLASAHRNLVRLLDDEEFVYAFRVLWYQGSKAQIGPTDMASPLMRERFRLSLPLHQRGDSGRAVNLDTPCPAVGCFTVEGVNWPEISLHPCFREEAGFLALRRLIRNWLLPRYDLLSAIHLAWVIRKGRGTARLWSWLLLAPLIFISTVVMASFISPGWLGWLPLLAIIGLLLLAIGMLDRASLVHLFLPRLWGGAVLGYLPLIFEEETWHMVRFLYRPWSLGALWVVCMLIAGLYLFIEARSITMDSKIALKRAAIVFAWALIVSFLAGLVIMSLSIPTYKRVFQCLDSFIIGPSGAVPLPGVLTFTPLALLVGIILQFIFEERPVTMPIWLPEER